MNLETLKQMYDGKNVDTIETEAKTAAQHSEDAHATLIRILFYLERTKRYKEVAGYKHASFARYIRDRFDMAESSYHSSRTVYVSMPEEAAKYGPGLVKLAVRKCGAVKAKDVLAKVQKREASRATPLPREEVEKAIEQNAKVKPLSVSGKLTYAELECRNAELRAENARLVKENKEQANRIEALLQTVAAFSEREYAEAL